MFLLCLGHISIQISLYDLIRIVSHFVYMQYKDPATNKDAALALFVSTRSCKIYLRFSLYNYTYMKIFMLLRFMTANIMYVYDGRQ